MPPDTGPADLTDRERRLLLCAVRQGYFAVPRRTTLVELAEANGMSDREASRRLRRSLDAVLRTALLDE